MLQSILTPLVRNGLRIVSGAMLGAGFSEGVSTAINSETVVGLGVLVLTEAWYLLARKRGWAT